MIKNIPKSIKNPDLIRSLGLPNSKNNRAVKREIHPIKQYRDPIKTIRNIKLDN
tara:strand:- start:324 stop:485 length:162 start_codon:yes stop_codon:yes gene_type:complete